MVTKTVCDADGWTDNRLVISDTRLRLEPVSAIVSGDGYRVSLFTSTSSPTLAPAAYLPPTATPVTDDYTVAARSPQPSDTLHSALIPPSTAAASITATTNSCIPPTDGTTSDVPSPSTITNNPASDDVDSVRTRPHCDRTFTSHIDLVSHLRIPRTETGEPVPGAPIYTHHTHLNCAHCFRTFIHRIGL
nr:unnamed protein product [Spirometra erinaceieuropaei]